ncbi:MAG: hypothetical protein JNL57_01100 [Bacteroidetes bacterium]|nr:hypothetical protein [Bacteroidota bacterium]
MLSLVRKLFWNAVLILAVVYGLYYFKIWPFKENVASPQFLKEKYCTTGPKTDDIAICDCIVERAVYDLKHRFTEKELSELEGNRAQMAYALHKSLEVVKPEAIKCLKDYGQEAAWDKFVHNLMALDTKVLSALGDLAGKGVDKAKEELEGGKQDKAVIDKKYQ